MVSYVCATRVFLQDDIIDPVIDHEHRPRRVSVEAGF